MRGNKLGVEKLGKSDRKNSYIYVPESTENLGLIKYIGSNVSPDLSVGMKVFYGDQRTRITIAGSEVEVMEDSNIYAIVEDSNDEAKK